MFTDEKERERGRTGNPREGRGGKVFEEERGANLAQLEERSEIKR